MNTEHERTLATIEQRALAEGVPPSDTDAYIADELRIPYDHYVAYQLVWGAIEVYSLAYPERSGRLRLVDVEPDSPESQLPPSLRRLFELAGTIHEAAVNGGDNRALVREQARRLIGELLTLAEFVLGRSGSQPTSASKSSGGAA